MSIPPPSVLYTHEGATLGGWVKEEGVSKRVRITEGSTAKQDTEDLGRC